MYEVVIWELGKIVSADLNMCNNDLYSWLLLFISKQNWHCQSDATELFITCGCFTIYFAVEIEKLFNLKLIESVSVVVCAYSFTHT